MLRILVCVSGGGTNLQAVMDAIRDGRITNTEIVGVISNNKNAYALTRAGQSGIDAVCLSPRDFPDRAAFNQAFLDKVDSYSPDLIVLAGFLVTIPAAMIENYRNRIINIHPSLIPSFCGVGFYGLKVHEAALAPATATAIACSRPPPPTIRIFICISPFRLLRLLSRWQSNQ